VNGAPERLQAAVGRVLRTGVIASSACLGSGLLLSMFGPTAGWAHGLLAAGLFALLATPVGRVVISLGEFALERDWVFAALTAIVLLELAASVVAALR
jgi:uncharacterized membrane protein